MFPLLERLVQLPLVPRLSHLPQYVVLVNSQRTARRLLLLRAPAVLRLHHALWLPLLLRAVVAVQVAAWESAEVAAVSVAVVALVAAASAAVAVAVAAEAAAEVDK